MRKLAFAFLLLASTSPAALAADRAGVSAGVRGDVLRVASAAGEPVGIKYKGGDAVFMGDGIESGPQAGMQVLLLDQTTFTIGPDSRLVIDEFVFDPRANAGKVGASIVKGGFRFVSGKIAANRPSDMTVKTPVATIGVRGTAVFGFVSPTETIIALAGPGRNNNTSDKVAGVDIFTPGGNAELRRAGFAARIVPGLPPDIIRVTPDLLRQIEGSIAPGGGNGTSGPGQGPQTAQGSGGSIASGGGIGNVAGFGSLGGADLGKTLETLDGLATSGELVATTAAQLDEAADITLTSGAVDFGDLTTYADLLATTSGTGTYSATGVAMVGTATGSYNFNLTIDFGMQTISGGFSNINLTGGMTITGASVPLSTSYNSTIAQVPVVVSNTTTCSAGLSCQGVAFLNNAGSVVAATATHALIITDNASNIAVGSGTTPRNSP